LTPRLTRQQVVGLPCAPPRSWTVTGPDPRGVPGLPPPVHLDAQDVDLRGLDHPTGASCRPMSVAVEQNPTIEHYLSLLCTRPSTDLPDARLLQEAEASIGLAIPIARSCSTRVVSHHLGGFLRAKSCGFIASRYQPWGSTRFAKPDSDKSQETIAARTTLPVS